MQNNLPTFDETTLNHSEKIMVLQILSMIESESFSMHSLVSIILILSDLFENPDFLKNDLEILKDPNNIFSYKDSELEGKLISLKPCRKASEVIQILFQNNKFKKYWALMNAAKLQSSIGTFCTTIHTTDFRLCADLNEFIDKVETTLQNVLTNLKSFNVPLSNGTNLNIDQSLMNKFGLIVMLREDQYICLNEYFRELVFNAKGIRTFTKELRRLLSYILEKDLNVFKEVDASFEKDGMLYSMMRVEISEIAKHFSKHDPKDYARTYEQTMQILASENFRRGLCPAALIDSETELPIAQVFANAIVSAIPPHLLTSN